MTSGASSLNPFAASYVPLFKRGATYVNNEVTPGHDFVNRGSEVVWLGHQPDNNSLGEISKPKDTAAHGGEFFASTSQYPDAAAIQTSFDEESDMELAYLQMVFPKMAEGSLSHVYHANRRDLEATVDMLNQLEICDDDVMDKLPDTLDIGDVTEYVSLGKPSHKVKNPTAGTGASTSGSSNTTSAS